MELTPEQKKEIERLHENESLTDNLDDASAQALLKWAEDRISANTDSQLVTAAVSAANQSGEASVEALVGNASAFLAQAESAHTQTDTGTVGALSASASASTSAAAAAPPEASQPPALPEPAHTGEFQAASTPSADVPTVVESQAPGAPPDVSAPPIQFQAPSAPSADAPTPPPKLPATTADTTAPLEPEAPPRKKSSSRRKKKKSAR